MVQLYAWLMAHLSTEEEGQGLVEYALIIALVAITLIGALGLLAGGISNVFGEITSALG